MNNFVTFHQIYSNICLKSLRYVSPSHKTWSDEFRKKGTAKFAKIVDFVIKSIVFCPLVPPCWISLVDPTSVGIRQQSMSSISMVLP